MLVSICTAAYAGENNVCSDNPEKCPFGTVMDVTVPIDVAKYCDFTKTIAPMGTQGWYCISK